MKPSSIESFIATLPSSYQLAALHAVKDEHDRLEREDYTEDERAMFALADKAGRSAAKAMDQIALEAMQGGECDTRR